MYRITEEGYKLARWDLTTRGHLSRAAVSSQDVASSGTRDSQEKHLAHSGDGSPEPANGKFLVLIDSELYL